MGKEIKRERAMKRKINTKEAETAEDFEMIVPALSKTN